jgi:hypothetical protein
VLDAKPLTRELRYGSVGQNGHPQPPQVVATERAPDVSATDAFAPDVSATDVFAAGATPPPGADAAPSVPPGQVGPPNDDSDPLPPAQDRPEGQL